MNLKTELELAQELGVNRNTVARWRMQGYLKPDKVSGTNVGTRYIYSLKNAIRQLEKAGKLLVQKSEENT